MNRNLRRVRIAGLGTYVPPHLLTNADLETMVEAAFADEFAGQLDCSGEDIDADDRCLGQRLGERRAERADARTDIQEPAAVAEGFGEARQAADTDGRQHLPGKRRSAALSKQCLVVEG